VKKSELTYGAEELEAKYPRSVLLSLSVSLTLVLASALYPLIRESLEDKSSTPIPVKAKKVVNYSELKAPPPIDLERPEPEIYEAKPKAKTVKYLPPKPKKDELVPDEEELPTLEELESSMIGTEDVEGVDSVVVEQEDVIIATEPTEVPEPAEVFEFVEVMPEFGGGQEAFNEYLSKNLKYPPMAKEAQIQGRVFVSFVVEKDGSITNVQIVRGVHPSLDEEARRVISDMPPWKPGRQNQRDVRVRFTLPISFVLK
jgi:protein TonB